MGLKRLETNKRFVIIVIIFITAVFNNCTVVFNPEVNADFTSTPISGLAPLNVQFTDISTGDITSWAWDFDNDSNVDSTLQSPANTYNNPGVYTVSLTITGPEGSDTETKIDYITVVNTPPVADFTALPLNGDAPLNVQFTDTSSGVITSWEWDFDDNSIVDSTLQNPQNIYNNPGIYTVSLTVIGPGGSDTATKIDYITVTEPAPVANFTATPTNGAPPLNVQFTDASTGNITSWAWDFDNSGGAPDSTLQNPQYSYNAGIYTVSLTVTGPGGSDTLTKPSYINVMAPIDFWQTLSATSLPGRYYHTAVWTGTEMIIWGGMGASPVYKNDGARFNPGTNIWTLTTMTNAPTQRYTHSAVWTGTEMIIWGGYAGGRADTGIRYNPGGNAWTPTALTNAPTGRYGHAAVWTGTEMIIWGG